MGSGAGAATEAVDHLNEAGARVGLLTVRLYRPFDTGSFVSTLPESTTKLVVLDRTKEPGAVGEPLYQDVVAALADEGRTMRVIGGRYGLSSKEFTPAMAARCLAEVDAETPKNHFTVGIVDDVTNLSLHVEDTWAEPDDVIRAVFFGLGSDGTVGANKATVKIVGTDTDLFAQGYFVYDSKKSGSQTVSHLRFGPRPITSTYLIDQAQFIGVHFFDLLQRADVLDIAAPGATVLMNSPFGEDTWTQLPKEAQTHIIDKGLDVHVVDASTIAKDAGLGRRVNTVLQTCFFALTDIMDTDEAIAAIKSSIEKAYGGRGEVVLRRNYNAVDAALAGLDKLEVPSEVTTAQTLPAAVPAEAPDFVQRVTAMMLAGKGDLLPVSAMPVDGTFPTATSQWEKRSIADEIPIWDPDICIDCGRCALVCPHAAIRMKVYDPDFFSGNGRTAPEGFKAKEWTGRDAPGAHMTIQVAPDDCTGCEVCVSICPAKSKEVVKHRAINMEPKRPHLEVERAAWDAFLEIPERDRTQIKVDNVKGSQMLQPLFEFSGACSGCGETPYIKLMSQMYGDRAIIANATGCSSIFGGNLPTTPYAVDAAGHGPAWSNSLFEDNAEFGLGMRLAVDQKRKRAEFLLNRLRDDLGAETVDDLIDADQSDEPGIAAQRDRVEHLKKALTDIDRPEARRLEALADALVTTSVWIIGGDGWAYDIGFGGLDHVLASGENVNVLVLDTEVYSNTGGQASKATPRAAVAKFAAGGKPTGKKDLGMIAMAYGNVYVAHVSMAANMTQVVKAFAEAEAHPGPSLIIAYSPCIAHGIDMAEMADHQKEAVESGYWPLYRYDPHLEAEGKTAFRLDSRPPTMKFADFARKEARFAVLARSNPEHAAELMEAAQRDIDDRWHLYEQMEDVEWTVHPEEEELS
jgi:pyruvate-ferredoxin/flavodoxin oxidoreductase